MNKQKQVRQEETANVITHGAGFIFGCIALVVLLLKAIPTHDCWIIVSVTIYGLCMTFSYVTSTFYHACRQVRRKRLWRRFDHSAIYLHIAGTYTPFTLVALRTEGYWGWSLFTIVWMSAALGVWLSFRKMKKSDPLKTACYLAMGWVVVIAFKPLLDVLRESGRIDSLYWLMAGGVFYTLGTIFFYLDRYPYMHPVWHLFVLGGSVCHFLAVYGLI